MMNKKYSYPIGIHPPISSWDEPEILVLCVYSDMVIYPGGLTVLKIDTAEKPEIPDEPISKMDILKAIKEHEDQYIDESEWQSRKERIECVNLITEWAKDHGMSYEEALGDAQMYIDLIVNKY